VEPQTAKATGAVYQVIKSERLTHIVQKVAGIGDSGALVCILSADTDAATLADLALAADSGRRALPSAAGGAPLQVTIGGMHCDHCRGVVRATLESIPDIVKAEVDRSESGGSAYLWIGLRVKDRDAVLAAAQTALADAGFSLEASRRWPPACSRCSSPGPRGGMNPFTAPGRARSGRAAPPPSCSPTSSGPTTCGTAAAASGTRCAARPARWTSGSTWRTA
jgi:copper chaperone CopZ